MPDGIRNGIVPTPAAAASLAALSTTVPGRRMGYSAALRRGRGVRPGGAEEIPARAALLSLTVDIVIPVFNEVRALADRIAVLHGYLCENLPLDWTITIADNASTDGTRDLAAALAESWPGVRVLRLEDKGKGIALRTAWASSDSDLVAYMDLDLSTGLSALLPLLAALASGHADIAIGSRLTPCARTVRSLKRDIVSRCYNVLLRRLHRVRLTDAQCGFKAARIDVVRALLPHIEDGAWFFDTELLLLAEHNGFRVIEIPVDWVEDPDSKVTIAAVAAANLRGLLRVRRAKLAGAATIAMPARPTPRSDRAAA